MRHKLCFVSMHLARLAGMTTLSRAAVNNGLWTLGLVLQCALVIAVFRRGIARRFKCYAALLCFYPLRAALLFTLAGRIDADVYNPLFSAFAFTEILLVAVVAVELIVRVSEEARGDTRAYIRHAALVLLGLMGVAGALTWMVIHFTPAGAPVDRAQIFEWALMISLFPVALRDARSANPVRIAAGFAAFSLIQLAASFGRAHALFKHDAGWYLAWSYTPAVGYLAVVVFWIITLQKKQSSASNTSPTGR